MNRSNFVIIGMPGSGKSTFGRQLAAAKGLGFVDTDTVIEQRFGCPLQTVFDQRGLKFMRALEETTICQLDVTNNVIAPGGSVVYSDAAMEHLQSIGTVVYLNISLQTLLRRVNNEVARGLFKLPATSLRDLYHERKNLYDRWADISLDNNKPLTQLQFDALLTQIAGATQEHV